ncbi:hypothetical protein [Marinactinospora rubrisoli]|uniref:Uncharacterized protein n=1 Tax=Marinactinospora rubrisoli TaxID=2715399 RepID=A0ABW2KMK9_9ACTN
MGAFLSALPQWVQLGVWGLGLISSASLTAIFGAKAYVSFQTDRSRRALLTGKLPKRAKYFPGTKTPLAEIDLVPQNAINDIQRQIKDLKTAVRPAERDLARVKEHTSDLDTLAKRLGERSTAYDRINTGLDDILKAVTEGQQASQSSSPAPAQRGRLQRLRESVRRNRGTL